MRRPGAGPGGRRSRAGSRRWSRSRICRPPGLCPAAGWARAPAAAPTLARHSSVRPAARRTQSCRPRSPAVRAALPRARARAAVRAAAGRAARAVLLPAAAAARPAPADLARPLALRLCQAPRADPADGSQLRCHPPVRRRPAAVGALPPERRAPGSPAGPPAVRAAADQPGQARSLALVRGSISASSAPGSRRWRPRSWSTPPCCPACRPAPFDPRSAFRLETAWTLSARSRPGPRTGRS